MTREEGLQQLVAIRNNFADRDLSNTNEAETRLLIIDEVLLLLGWKKEDFSPEHYSSGAGYLDYLLKIDRKPHLVVEAKRASSTFRSHRTLAKTNYNLAYLKTAFGPEFSEVIKQAQRYGREENVPFGLVTNGNEWLLLQLVPRPGLTEKELKAYYFGNIFRDEFQFELFYSLASKAAVAENAIPEAFAQLNVNEAEFSQAPKSQIGGLIWRPSTDKGYRNLGEFYRLFFDEMTDPGRRAMLERCFITDSKLSQHEAELKRVLKDVAPSYLTDAKELSPGEHAAFIPGATGDQKGTVILLVGSVGAGKSTFVTKVMVDHRKSEDKKDIIVVLDLINEPQMRGPDIRDRFYTHVADEWRCSVEDAVDEKTLKQVFHSELNALQRSKATYFKAAPEAAVKEKAELISELCKDDTAFVQRSFRYFQSRGKSIIIVLDNVDRNSEEFQQEAYTFAQDIAKRTGATVIVSMRESTFYRGRDQGFLDVRTSDWVFHLQAPDLVQVVAARTKYIKQHVERDHRYRQWRAREDSEEFLKQIRNYADTLTRSLLKGQEAKKMRDLLAAVAWHNVREFFRILHRTHLVLGPDAETWKFSEVVASLGVNKHHGQRSSLLPSIYQVPSNRARAHFLNIRILSLITGSVNEQFSRFGVSFDRLKRMIAAFGYSHTIVRTAVENLVRSRLLECVNIPTEVEFTANYQLSRGHAFKISPLGVVMLESVQFTEPYLATSAYEVEIQSQDAFERITHSLKDFRDAVGEDGLDRNALSLLESSEVISEFAEYLRSAYQYEELFGGAYGAEVECVERYIREVVLKGLKSLTEKTEYSKGGSDNVEFKKTADADSGQMELFSTNDEEEEGLKSDLPIPAGILDKSIGRSTYAPKILWALVALKAIGVKEVGGAQITKMINANLVDYPVETTNVSRALRGATLQQQEWLHTREDVSRPLYSLAEQWRHSWENIFKESPPF